jgi:NADH-quinone oxidoreductase subunit J
MFDLTDKTCLRQRKHGTLAVTEVARQHDGTGFMNIAFYTAAATAVVMTVLTISRVNVVHALLCFVLSLLATGVMFYVLGATFVAAVVVIINAGAIMVLFVFVIMMLNMGPQSAKRERARLKPHVWIAPGLVSLALLASLMYSLVQYRAGPTPGQLVPPKVVGMALFGPYLLGVELASMLLLAGLLGAYHLGQGAMKSMRRQS